MSEPQDVCYEAKHPAPAAMQRLILQLPSDEQKREADFLSRLFRLDSYSRRLLSKRARSEMGLAAMLVLAIALFEMVAWTILFNALLNGEVLVWSQRSWIALAAGCVYAFAVVYLDRSYFVADTGQKGYLLAAIFRVVLVTLSALATSLALDLVFFERPIEKRIHQEGVRLVAVELAGNLLDTPADRTEERERLERVADRFTLQIKEAEDKIQNKLTELDQAGGRLSQRSAEKAANQARLGALPDEISQLERRLARLDPFSVDYSEAQAKLTDLRAEQIAASREQASATTQATNLQGTQARLRTEVVRLQARRDDLVRGRDDALADLRGDLALDEDELRLVQERIPTWIATLRRQDSPLTMTEQGGGPTAFTYKQSSYGLFERTRVLGDLVAGRPPRWPAESPELISQLKARLHLEDPSPCLPSTRTEPPPKEAPPSAAGSSERPGTTVEATPAASADTRLSPESSQSGVAPTLPCDDTEWQRLQETASFYRAALLVVLLVSMVIPLLVVVVKLVLMPQALKTYYSVRCQARAGDPDAILEVEANRRAEPVSGRSG